ncbi:MAG: hypothetical protein J3K34DRAFT_516155 [Monoraphidium minutum]|nr:MAG: hypothetical protein J3K34DRAFT_516155 [Monoraphidium minutum]
MRHHPGAPSCGMAAPWRPRGRPAAIAAAPLLLLVLLAADAPRAARAWSLGGIGAAVSERARAAAAELVKGAAAPAEHDHGAAAAAAAFDSITADVPGGGAAAAAPADPAAAAARAAAAASRDAAPALIRTLSVKPRAMLWSKFMTLEECDHLVKLGALHLTKSDVVNSDTGDIMRSQERTSSGAFLPGRRIDPVVKAVEERIARWAQLPLHHGEPFHILRYNPSEEYTAHFDIFFDNVHVQNGGQRVATVILYLSDVEEGGETVFPDSPTRPPLEEAATFSDCAKKGLGVRPYKGDALLFFSLKPDGKTHDVASLHAGCPVIRGTKWIATKWMRVGHYRDWGDPEDADAPPAAALRGDGPDDAGEFAAGRPAGRVQGGGAIADSEAQIEYAYDDYEGGGVEGGDDREEL